MPNYPFQRAKALGYALFENFPSAHANIIDANAAQAADGLVWTDVAAFKNWSAAQSVSGRTAFYNSETDVWTTVDVNAGNPLARVMVGSSGPLVAITIGSLSSLTPRKRAADYNPTANVGLVGGVPGASSNKKYVRFTSAFTATMATVASSQTNTNGVACLKWVPALGLWVAGHEGNGVIETSPDALTFTNRGVPNANPRNSMAVGPINGLTGGIVMTSSASTNKVVHSVDGITWNERTMPATRVWNQVVYIPLLGKYLAIGESVSGMESIAVSTDGITWTAQSTVMPVDTSALNIGYNPTAVAFGRTVYCAASSISLSGVVMMYSQDGGAVWKFAAGTFGSSIQGALATNGRQLMYVDDTSSYSTIGAGF